MGIGVARKRNKSSKSNRDSTTGYDDWVRNPSWLAMPTVTASEQKIVGLFAVFPESNFLTFNFTMSTGGYTVNWGDGTTENIANNTQSNHQYDFANANLADSDRPVTFTQSTSTVNRTAHGYTNGMKVKFYNLTFATGLKNDNEYFVINATTNTFQISSTLGGSALSFNNDSTGTLLPYKQALVTVTPTTGGATFTAIYLANKHSQTGLSSSYGVNYLDLTVSAPNATIFSFGAGTVVPKPYLERANIVSLAAMGSGVSYMFQNCYSLRSVSLGNTANWSNWSYMFSYCTALKTLPPLDMTGCTNAARVFERCSALEYIPPIKGLASCTSFNYMFIYCTSLKKAPYMNISATNATLTGMFSNCYSLVDVPLYKTSNVTNTNSMFYYCTSLRSVPKFNLAKVTNMGSMFGYCYSLNEVPDFTYTLAQDLSSMFLQCNSLESVYPMNLPAATTLSYLFSNCWKLKNVPAITTSTTLLTNTANMFEGCYSLKDVPWFNTDSVTNMSSMFSNCFSLKTCPTYTTSSCKNFASMFNASNLKLIPALNATAITGSASLTNIFGGGMISKIEMTNLKYSFTVANTNLSPAALDALYTALPTVTGQTITVTSCWGNTADTPTIATAKGWTVTG